MADFCFSNVKPEKTKPWFCDDMLVWFGASFSV